MHCLVVACLLLLASPVMAQDQKSDVHLGTLVVPITTSVFDNDGRFISGLSQADFELYDNGKRVPISSISDQDAPVNLIIDFDVSGSMINKEEAALNALEVLMQRSRPDDQVGVYVFNEYVNRELYLTPNRPDILAYLPLEARPSRGTELRDALVLSIDDAQKQLVPLSEFDEDGIPQATGLSPTSRLVVVVISDGQDQGSGLSQRRAKAKLAESGALVYGLCIVPNKHMRDSDAEYRMKELCEATGGRCFFVEKDEQLPEFCNTIALEIRKQYQLIYYPADNQLDGKMHRLEVRLVQPEPKSKGRPKRHIFARGAYRAVER